MRAQRTPDGPPPEPAVQRLRLRYAKRGRLRFSSTRDFQRALERALRRADVPMAFSAGFHPHPRISYANAAPTGTASEAEYVELSVTARLDPEAVRVALDQALPAGLDVLEVVEAPRGRGDSLADRLEASEWVLAFADVERPELQRAVDAALAQERLEVTRTFKTGPKTFDIRPAIVAMTAEDGNTLVERLPEGVPAGSSSCAIIRVVVRHTTPVARPDDILTALRAVAGLVPPRSPLVTRLAQGPLNHEVAAVADPLAAEEKAGGS
jgi:radical SAM-linked protein